MPSVTQDASAHDTMMQEITHLTLLRRSEGCEALGSGVGAAVDVSLASALGGTVAGASPGGARPCS